MAEPIEMPFGFRTRVAQGIMLDVGPDLHGRDNFKGGRGGPL